jgi:hypothetical protein
MIRNAIHLLIRLLAILAGLLIAAPARAALHLKAFT